MKTPILFISLLFALLFSHSISQAQMKELQSQKKNPFQLGFQANTSRFIENIFFPNDPGALATGLGLEVVVRKQLSPKFQFYTGLGVEWNLVDDTNLQLSNNPASPTFGIVWIQEERFRIFTIEIPTLIDYQLLSFSSLDVTLRTGLVFHWTRSNILIEGFQGEPFRERFSIISDWQGLLSPDLRAGLTVQKKVKGFSKHEFGIDVQAYPNFWRNAFQDAFFAFNRLSPSRRVQCSVRYTFYPYFDRN